MEFITNNLDKGDSVDVIFLDFAKAFDKVPHARLLQKISALGIQGKLHMWIKNWLQDRRQRVVLNGHISTWEAVGSGVPQGSVLGPLLFTIFINDIDENLTNRLLKFADDTKILGKVSSHQDAQSMREDLKKISKWSETWQMNFNLEKCKVMHLGPRNSKTKFDMLGHNLEEITEERDLGVIISHDGKVAKQCATAAKKGYQTLGLISRTFTCKKKSIILQLYKSLVRPHLDYSIQAWRPHLQKDIDVLERVQRRATRMVEECKGLDYTSRLQRLNLTTLETRRIRADLLQVFKIMNGIDKVDEKEFFTRHKDKATSNTTQGNMITRGNSLKLKKKRFRLDIAKYNFGNRVVNNWNKLPNDIVNATSIDAFKGKLDSYMLHCWGLV